jgi:hypothetical protein
MKQDQHLCGRDGRIWTGVLSVPKGAGPVFGILIWSMGSAVQFLPRGCLLCYSTRRRVQSPKKPSEMTEECPEITYERWYRVIRPVSRLVDAHYVLPGRHLTPIT